MARVPIWTTTITAITIAIVTVLGYLRQRQKTRFDYESISIIRLFPPSGVGRVAEKLGIIYGKTPVKDPCIAIFRLINSGKVPIGREDFQQSVRIDLGYPVVEVDLVKTHPPGLAAELADKVTWEGTEARLSPSMFNPGDWLALLIVTDGEPKPVTPIIRIKGGVSRAFSPHKIWLTIIRADIASIGMVAAAAVAPVALLVSSALVHRLLQWLVPETMEKFDAGAPDASGWPVAPYYLGPIVGGICVFFLVVRLFDDWRQRRIRSYNVDLNSV